MGKKDDQTGAGDTGGVVTLITSTESRHWELTQAVAALHREGYDTSSACKKLGIARSTYYEAMKSRYVQEQRVAQIQAMQDASATIVDKYWARIMNNMAMIASSGDSKESVQAARFVRDVVKDLEKQAETMDTQEQESALALFANQLKGTPGRRTYKAKRSTTRGQQTLSEEISVEIS